MTASRSGAPGDVLLTRPLSSKLLPSALLKQLLAADPKNLDSEFFGPLLLLVRAPADETGQLMARELEAAVKGAVQRPLTAPAQITTEFAALAEPPQEPSAVDQVELIAALGRAIHLVVPLFRCGRTSALLGRAMAADVRIDDPSVSSQHAEFLWNEDGFRLRDLGSKNGTRCNETALRAGGESWLQPMDRVGFGRIEGFLCQPRALRAVVLQELRSEPP